MKTLVVLLLIVSVSQDTVACQRGQTCGHICYVSFIARLTLLLLPRQVLLQFAGVRLMSNGVAIENHSFLKFTDVATGDNALMCMSENTECCTTDNANWYLPGSDSPITTTEEPGYFVTRGSNYVALNRESGDTDVDGLYRCEILGTDGNIQKLYVWLDHGSQGRNCRMSLSVCDVCVCVCDVCVCVCVCTYVCVCMHTM